MKGTINPREKEQQDCRQTLRIVRAVLCVCAVFRTVGAAMTLIGRNSDKGRHSVSETTVGTSCPSVDSAQQPPSA
jgi:hypothetical protein